MIDSVRNFVRHPMTVGSAALASASSLFSVPFLDPLMTVVWTNIGQLFTAFSIGAFTVVPNIDLPVAQAGEAIQITALLLGVAYAAKLGLKVGQQAIEKLD